MISCINDPNSFPVNSSITCDAEMTNKKGEFVSSDDSLSTFSGGKLQTDIDSYSGKHSVLTIPKKSAFALTYEIKRTAPNTYFKISVWRKSKDGNGSLVISAKDSKVFYRVTKDPVEKNQDGWEKLILEANTPPNFHGGLLKIYVWNNGTDSVFFDDLTISRPEKKEYPNYDYSKGLNIVIDTSDYLKIMRKRYEAFEVGILQTSDKDWVKGIIVDDDIAKKTKMRLKGDWLDHLWGDKWSYRVKMRKNNTYRRLRTFSLQTPASRNYLIEWLTHKLYHSKDILTTRYWFTPVSFNGKPRGLYAVEEHFVKQLPEWNNRREGPILKFTEDAFWQIQKMSIHNNNWPVFPFYEASVIVPFKQSRTVSNPVLFNQFLDGQKLMQQYKYNKASAHQIFDIDKLAMYYAMLDLTHARHGMAWHNQRFYFNPVIRKLEPIAFDGYTNHENFIYGLKGNLGYKTLTSDATSHMDLIYALFKDSVFVNRYLGSLEEISNEKFINNFLESVREEEQYYDSLLRMEFPSYPYDKDFLKKSAEEIRTYLPELIDLFAKSRLNKSLKDAREMEIYTDTSVFENTPEYFLIAYSDGFNEDRKTIEIVNYFPQKISLVGSGINKKLMTEFFTEIKTIDPYTTGIEGERLLIEIDTASNYLYFMLGDNNETYSIPIYPWSYPRGITSQQSLYELASVKQEIVDRVEDNQVYIRTGKYVIDKPVIFPSGYTINFTPGTHIDIINSAMIISYSPVNMIGSVNSPVKFTSSDFTGNGITVLQAGETSFMDNVVVENMNTLSYEGWILTGAVTFYESDVEIKNTTFYRNQCEDAFNTIRSNFLMDNCSFDYTFGDAFDADFCEGTIMNSTYTNIGNDAMDFSGSDILITNTTVNVANDKGISGGEDSRVKIENVTVEMANIGFASKDLSFVEVIESKAISCNYGLVLLQKKPEYGPSQMILKNTSLTNSKTDYIIEVGSQVIMEGDTIPGTEIDLGLRFY